MKKIIALIAIGVLVYGAISTLNKPLGESGDVFISEQDKVQDVVTDFGEKLKNVSLLAPKDILISTIEREYGPYITPGLMERYRNDPTHAPGRDVSSPWPEKIEVKSMEKVGNYYEVEGEVLLMASTGEAGRYPVYLTVAELNDKWLVAEYQTSME